MLISILKWFKLMVTISVKCQMFSVEISKFRLWILNKFCRKPENTTKSAFQSRWKWKLIRCNYHYFEIMVQSSFKVWSPSGHMQTLQKRKKFPLIIVDEKKKYSFSLNPFHRSVTLPSDDSRPVKRIMSTISKHSEDAEDDEICSGNFMNN